MVMNAVEIMALILIVVATVKIMVIIVNPKTWFNGVVKKVWMNPVLMMIVSLILAGVSLYYLLDSGITIVQIFAVMLFISFLAAIGVAIYQKEVIKLAEKLTKNKSLVKKSWLYILIWIVLLLWGLKELFMPSLF